MGKGKESFSRDLFRGQRYYFPCFLLSNESFTYFQPLKQGFLPAASVVEKSECHRPFHGERYYFPCFFAKQ